jgi:hypothetical protein
MYHGDTGMKGKTAVWHAVFGITFPSINIVVSLPNLGC